MTCCYLCKNTFECSLQNGGVFVPLQDHFEQFCLTDKFVNCHHFIEYATACGVAPTSAFASCKLPSLPSEKRVCVRKKAEFPVTLSSYDRERAVMVDFASNALVQTIDFGMGGMRVRSTKQMAKQGLLFFSFGEGFIAPLLHGFAEVCWQKKSSDDGDWEAGLSFTDLLVKAKIAVRMSS